MKTILLFLTVVSFILEACDASRDVDLPQSEAEAAPTVVQVPAFDGDQAYTFLVDQTEFGPRNPGSSGHRRCLEYLSEKFRLYADSVTILPFTATTFEGSTQAAFNVVARFNLHSQKRIILSAHWDTRPKADQDPDPKKRSLPILGANDGASGVAVLLELARLMKSAPPPQGVDIVLFDLEDSGESGYDGSWSLGAQHFAAIHLQPESYEFGINLDMVGDANLEIRREVNSDLYASQIADRVFATAKLLNVYQFLDEPGHQIQDDHIPLNEAGLPAVDIIDFDYPDENHDYWHTTNDTADKCSPESLTAVGTVITHIVYGQTAER